MVQGDILVPQGDVWRKPQWLSTFFTLPLYAACTDVLVTKGLSNTSHCCYFNHTKSMQTEARFCSLGKQERLVAVVSYMDNLHYNHLP